MKTVLLYNLITFFLATYSYEVSRQVKYEGCMKKTDNSRDFERVTIPIVGGKVTPTDVTSCVKECWFQRNKVAALQKGNECYCAKSEMNVVHVPEDECSRRCQGNCYQTCGGENVMSVYQTGYVPEMPFEIDKNVLKSVMVGCYPLLDARHILCDANFAPLTTDRMTVPMCVIYCDSVHKAQFATLSGKDSCCCSNSVAGARTGLLWWCNLSCKGARGIGCVGMIHNKFRVATFHISRLPSFKRWPKETFTKADWLEPIFPAGETFTNVKQKLIREAEDASLSGLVARKMARQPGEGDGKYGGMSGLDKREPAQEGIENNVAVLDVARTKVDEDEDKTYVVIIVAVVIGFAIFTAAFGFYMFSKKSIMEEKNSNANAKVRRRRRRERRNIRKSSRSHSRDRHAV